MEELTEMFSKVESITIYNNTGRLLYLHEGGLYTGEHIAEGTEIGEIKGYPTYICDIPHRNFLFIDGEYVLDTHRYKSNILSYIREENETTNVSNCYLKMRIDASGEGHIYLVTKTAVLPKQELVYHVADFMGPYPGEEAYLS